MRPLKAKPLDRARLRKLLALLGSSHDGEVLSAARRVTELLAAAETDWDALLPDLEAEAAPVGSDRAMIEALLASGAVSDILKLRLRGMRATALAGRLAERDRLYLRILYRKAVIDGSVVEA